LSFLPLILSQGEIQLHQIWETVAKKLSMNKYIFYIFFIKVIYIVGLQTNKQLCQRILLNVTIASLKNDLFKYSFSFFFLAIPFGLYLSWPIIIFNTCKRLIQGEFSYSKLFFLFGNKAVSFFLCFVFLWYKNKQQFY